MRKAVGALILAGGLTQAAGCRTTSGGGAKTLDAESPSAANRALIEGPATSLNTGASGKAVGKSADASPPRNNEPRALATISSSAPPLAADSYQAALAALPAPPVPANGGMALSDDSSGWKLCRIRILSTEHNFIVSDFGDVPWDSPTALRAVRAIDTTWGGWDTVNGGKILDAQSSGFELLGFNAAYILIDYLPSECGSALRFNAYTVFMGSWNSPDGRRHSLWGVVGSSAASPYALTVTTPSGPGVFNDDFPITTPIQVFRVPVTPVDTVPSGGTGVIINQPIFNN